MNQSRTLLPMLGHTRGNRNAATCQFKCGNACAKDVCNTTDNGYFRDIADAALSRRSLLGLGAVASAALVVGTELLQAPSAHALPVAAPGSGGKLRFDAIAPVPRSSDTLSVPEGYDWSPVIRWGDPLFKNAPSFKITKQSAKAQAGQFGYNNDYLNVIVDKYSGRTGVLVANHEYTNEDLMFDPEWFAANKAEGVRIAMAAHGFSVVEVKRSRTSERWEYIRGG